MSQLARELQAEPDEQAMRQRITQAALSEIDGATWAGITLVEGKHLHTVAQTAQLVREIDQVQYRTGEGPCVRSLREHAIGQAKGILMERHKINAQQAFDMLVYASQHTHRKLHELADHIAATGELPTASD
jgi:hypothetical protein